MAVKPMADQDFQQLMTKARRRNKCMDTSDRRAGLAAPSDCTLSLQLRTVMSAVECGLRCGDNETLAEGLAMLEIIELAVRTAGQ